MKYNRKIKKYADALLSVSKGLNCISETGNSLQILDQLIKDERVFRAFFYTQKIKPLEKVEILKVVLGDSINQIIYEYIALLAERNENQIFASVVAAYLKLQKGELNKIDVTTYSIDKIDKKTISSIIYGIEKSSGKIVELDHKLIKNY